jgi:hypothetical protein
MRGDRAVRVVVASLVLVVGCAHLPERPSVPLIVAVNYRVIRGTVGRELACGPQLPCESPRVLVAAKIDEGALPPGLTLNADGTIGGTPEQSGEWHAMLRSARLQCDDKVEPDRWQTFHFEIAEKTDSGAEKR